MLLSFSVENFLSFRRETVFDMFPSGLQTMREHVLHDTTGKKVESLPVSILFGPNASGKSNLLKAIQFADRFIKLGVGLNEPIPIKPYILASQTKRLPSRFEFVFKTNGVVYTYGFLLSSQAVEEEWLYAYFSSREEVVFERKFDQGKTIVRLGRRLKKREMGGADTCVHRNILFLTFAHEKSAVLEAAYHWFARSLQVISAGTSFDETAEYLHQHPDIRRFIADKIREIDTAVESISTRVEKRKPSVGNFEDHGTLSLDEEIFHTLYTQYLDSEGNKIEMPIQSESDGTRRLLELLPILHLNSQEESVVFIDEIDRSLHPLLSRWFLKNCLDLAKTKGGCQFIFTTHDTNLLDRHLLRRDEIWFMEKDENGSCMSRLSEFKVNEGLNYEHGYLNGRFGALPYLTVAGEVL